MKYTQRHRYHSTHSLFNQHSVFRLSWDVDPLSVESTNHLIQIVMTTAFEPQFQNHQPIPSKQTTIFLQANVFCILIGWTLTSHNLQIFRHQTNLHIYTHTRAYCISPSFQCNVILEKFSLLSKQTLSRLSNPAGYLIPYHYRYILIYP